MGVAVGMKLGPYEVLAPLGVGGMGEVYRARDSKLNRDVAIKVLPELVAADGERLARLTREAQTLAALNHPNIATIYGIEEFQGGRALVMELVEGEDLSAIIARSPIPVADALPIAKQIADALEAAHEQGIVHRDLKPANIKVRADGTAKVLDFGLAKALDAAGASGLNAATSPTLTAPFDGAQRGYATQMGVILGTAAYMAPEQARGKSVDRRGDIWAFGVVLYEMLTGRRAFLGEEISDVLASVLKTEPDWSALPADLPPSVRRLLRRCLEKDPRKRLSAIGDAKLELNESDAVGPAGAAPRGPSLLARVWPAAAGVVLTAIVAALLWSAYRPTSGAGPVRLSVLAPPGMSVYPDSASVAISPDGSMVAFVVGDLQSVTELWVRPLDSLTAKRLEGTEGANLPFWSPDSRRIGFFTRDKLKTVAVAGGRAEAICDAPGSGGRGAAWSPSNVIVFARDASGPLYRVSANGGEPTPVTTIDASGKHSGHRFPVFLPDGEHFLFAALPGRGGKFDIFAGSLRDGSSTMVGSMESAPVYAEPGWLLYARQGVLAAQPFDARAMRVTGETVSLGDEPTSMLDPSISYTAGHSTSVSSTGSLAYYSSPSENTTATWIDTVGTIGGTINLPQGRYSGVSVSPDGTRAVVVRSMSVTESSLWLMNLAHGGGVQLSSGRGRNDSPVWSPDGTRVVFASDRDGPQDLFVKVVGNPSPEQPLYRSPVVFKSPDSWSSDGRWIVFNQLEPDTAQNIWLLPASGSAAPVPFLRGPLRDYLGRPSPDGRWLAYVSDDTGRFELYAESFPEGGHKRQISTEGATVPWWTRDGRHLLFIGGDGKSLWRAEVDASATLNVGAPSRIATLPSDIAWMDAMPDGQRFLALMPERAGTGSVTVVQNWRAAIEKRP